MPAFVCPSITWRTLSQTSKSSRTLLAQSNKDSIEDWKKSANLAYSDQELRETGVQSLKAYAN
eukprot:scaffold7232_cov63-Cyclotella_meneghiniana.AAC.2